jgi:hypothetical protein
MFEDRTSLWRTTGDGSRPLGSRVRTVSKHRPGIRVTAPQLRPTRFPEEPENFKIFLASSSYCSRKRPVGTEASEPCSFCENTADTQEHVIPEWLQRYFSLWTQRLQLWNGTDLFYRQALIPACTACNTGRFSRLEQRVQSGQATRQELYLWALKIRYGLALRDTALLLDRRNPGAGPLLDRRVATYGESFIRHAFRALDGKPFAFRPTPFGSVFRFPQNPTTAGRFGLVDVPPPYWALAVVLPSNEILVVLFADRGVTKQIVVRHSRLGRSLSSLSEHMPDLEPQTLVFSLLRVQNHLMIPDGLQLLAEGVISERIPTKIALRPQRLEWYREIASHCGLSNEVADEAYRQDRERLGAKFLRRG